MTHQIASAMAPSYVDKRRSFRDDFETRIVTGPIAFTANAIGTTTTLVGSNGFIVAPNNTNVIRIGEEFKLFTTAGVLKQETVFRITNVQTAASTTVTFTPAANVATASGDNFRFVDADALASNGNKDRRLVELGFTAARVASMSENDKDYQLRVSDDPGSI